MKSIDEALNSPVKSMKDSDREITFRSVDELKELKRMKRPRRRMSTIKVTYDRGN